MPRFDRTATLVDGTGNPITPGNPLPVTGGASGSVLVPDGFDVCEGATTDAAVMGDNPGTLSAKLRGLSKILFSVWDSLAGALRVTDVGSAASDPQVSYQTVAAIAAGSATNFDSDPIASGKTAFLTGLVASCSLPFKVELVTVTNGIASGNRVVRIAEGGWDWSPPARNYITVAEDPGVGFDGFRITLTNLDPSEPGDGYVTFFYDQA